MKLNWEGPLFHWHSYSIVNRHLVRQLIRMGYDVRLIVREPGKTNPDDFPELADLAALTTPHKDPNVTIRHTWPVKFSRPKHGALIIMQPWEYGYLPKEWLDSGLERNVDLVLTYSQAIAATYMRSGFDQARIKVIGLGIDPTVFHPAETGPTSSEDAAASSLELLAITTPAPRKGPDLLLEAYRDAFKPADSVRLRIRLSGLESETAAFIRNVEAQVAVGSIPPVEFIKKRLSQTEVADLYRSADVLVHPFRAEGFGLPLLEAAGCGLTVITSDTPPASEIFAAGTAILIPGKYEIVPDQWGIGMECAGWPFWFEPQAPALAEALRWVFEHRKELPNGRQKIASAAADWTWERAAERIAEALDAFGARPVRTQILNESSPEAAAEDVAATDVSHTKVIVEPFPFSTESEELSPANTDALPSTELPSIAVPVDAVRVCLEGSFFSHTSFANVNRMWALGLSAMGYPVSVRPQELPDFETEHAPNLEELVALACSGEDAGILLRHMWPPDFEKREYGKLILCQPWEYGFLPKSWMDGLNAADEIWCYGSYHREVYERSGVDPKKLHIVPLGVDLTAFSPNGPIQELPSEAACVFMYCGAAFLRKGIDLLLEAYIQEFDPDEDVLLVIKETIYPVDEAQEFRQNVKRILAQGRHPQILYMDRNIPYAQLPALFRACDVYAHPYRGEGFGLPILEAMACGKPVLVPDSGAARDFVTDASAYLVKSHETPVPDGLASQEDCVQSPVWIESDLASLRLALREAYQDAETRKRKGAAARRAAEQFSWQRSVCCAAERLVELSVQLNKEAGRPSKPELHAKPCQSTPKVSIIIPTCNNISYTKQCLDSLGKHAGMGFEAICVDNASTDGTREYLRFVRGLSVLEMPENKGFAAACNAGAAVAKGEYLVFLNNDTVSRPGWLPQLLSLAESDRSVGVVGAKLLYPDDGTIQHVWLDFNEEGELEHRHRGEPPEHPDTFASREVLAVTGACFLVPRRLFQELGGFDEGFRNGCEDVDFCWRAKAAGYKVMYCAESVLEHWEGRTPGRFDHVLHNLQRLREKWPEPPGLARQAGTDKSRALGTASNKAGELQESKPVKIAPSDETSGIAELEMKPAAPPQTGTGEADVQEEMQKDPTIQETEEEMATPKQHALPETGLGIQVTAPPQTKPGSISLCMIVKDEEEFLGDCLQSVQGLVDEIVVCDTGSADNTKLIAEQHGAKVYDIPWENDFAKARKQSFDRATSEWILWLDADERLTPDSHAAIKEAVRSDAENAYFLRIRNYADASGLDYFIHFLPRLFRNGEDVQIQGAIHECVVFDHLAKDGHIGALDAEIVHLGYAAKIVQDRRKVDRNIDILKRQIEQNPQDAFAHHNLGGMYRDIGLHNQAISEFKEALKYAQGNETYYPVLNLRMASSYEALAQYDEGIRHCRETLRYEPQNCEAHYILGQCMLAKGESQQAAAAFAAALACPESFSLSTVDVTTRGYKGEFGLALALMQQQRYGEALVHARRAAELNPKVGRIWNGVGFCAIETGCLEEAEQALQRAIQLTPQLTDAWLNLGCVLGMKGDPQGAEHAFKQALRLSPEHPAVMANLGLCLSEQGRLSEAEEWLLLAVASVPDNPDAYLKLSEMYRRHERYGDAISIIEIALTHTPGVAVLWQQIGRCYEEAGSPEAAQIAYEKAQVLAGNGPGEIFAVGNRLAS